MGTFFDAIFPSSFSGTIFKLNLNSNSWSVLRSALIVTYSWTGDKTKNGWKFEVVRVSKTKRQFGGRVGLSISGSFKSSNLTRGYTILPTTISGEGRQSVHGLKRWIEIFILFDCWFWQFASNRLREMQPACAFAARCLQLVHPKFVKASDCVCDHENCVFGHIAINEERWSQPSALSTALFVHLLVVSINK